MRKNPQKKKGGFRDVLLNAPGGKFVLAFWDWKAGIGGKLIAAIIMIIGGLVWLYFHLHSQQASQSVTTTGKNAPVTIQTANAMSNSTVIQAAPGSTANNGISDESIKLIREGMLAIQKEKDAELKSKFSLGYILFTATDRNEVVPLNSPMDEVIKIDWKSGYTVTFTDTHIMLSIGHMVIHFPNSITQDFHDCNFGVLRRIEPWARPGIYNDGVFRVAFKAISTHEDSAIIAMGIESPPEPRPPLSELMK
jgi:hypothetical protein